MNKYQFLVLSLSLVTQVAAAEPVTINGAGATFPYPLYSKWFSDYNKIDANAQFNYQSIGSGGGIKNLLDKSVDFGASDAPMKDEDMAKSQVKIYHFPTVLGAVVVTYNLPELKSAIKLTPEAVADLFLGKIKKWNDPAIAKLNPGAKLPDLPVMIVHRSDGSGTTAIFTDYLSSVSPEWKEKVGKGGSVNWPTGLGGKGNEGVTGTIKQMPGTLGYVELIFAEKNALPVASIKNADGAFVSPSVESVTEAAKGSLKSMPEDFRVSIVNAKGKKSYPISGFTYLLVYEKMKKAQGDKLAKFIKWALTDGQKAAPALSYAPLPESLAKKVIKQIANLKTE